MQAHPDWADHLADVVDRRGSSNRVSDRPVRLGRLRRQNGHTSGGSGRNAGFGRIPDSLVSGAAAIDFGTKRGASTAAGMIDGFGSAGAIIGGMLPGLVQRTGGNDADIWSWVFASSSSSILLAGFLLLPKWNVLPLTAGDAKGEACQEELCRASIGSTHLRSC